METRNDYRTWNVRGTPADNGYTILGMTPNRRTARRWALNARRAGRHSVIVATPDGYSTVWAVRRDIAAGARAAFLAGHPIGSAERPAIIGGLPFVVDSRP